MEEPNRDLNPPEALAEARWLLETLAAGDVQTRESRLEAERGIKAMRLAPTLGVYDALLRGERVPVSALEPKWVARYGLRDA